jgi:hypothetical protein
VCATGTLYIYKEMVKKDEERKKERIKKERIMGVIKFSQPVL